MMSFNKKQPTNITPEKLQKSALYYLSRYSASEKMLKDFLLRKFTQPSKEAIAIIKPIILHMKQYGYLDDQKYAQNKAHEWFLKGKSKEIIKQKLLLKGIGKELIVKILTGLDEENNYDTDLIAGINYAQKKKIGPFRSKLKDKTVQKELSKMARAGFTYEVAQKIVFAKNTEELKKLISS